MANLQIQTVQTAQTPQVERTQAQAGAAAEQARKTAPPRQGEDSAAKERIAEELEEALEKQFGSVVSTSEDGDTVRVSDQGEERLDDERLGRVVPLSEDGTKENAVGVLAPRKAGVPEVKLPGNAPKEKLPESQRQEDKVPGTRTQERVPEAAELDAERLAREIVSNREEIREQREEAQAAAAEQTYKPQITSYAGYSDSQLEQMWLKGEISKIDYDQEIESREEERETQETDRRQFGAEMAGVNTAAEQSALDAQQIRTAFGPNASDTVDAATRVAAMTGLEDVALPNS